MTQLCQVPEGTTPQLKSIVRSVVQFALQFVLKFVVKSLVKPVVKTVVKTVVKFVSPTPPARGWTYKLGGGVGVRLGEC